MYIDRCSWMTDKYEETISFLSSKWVYFIVIITIILYYLDNCDINSSYPYKSQWTNVLGNLSTSLDNPECYQHSLVTDGKTENPCPLTADPAPSSCV